MDIIDRINEVISHEGLKVSTFAKNIGVGDQTIRGIVVQRRNKPSYDILARIIQTFPWLNATWLITGEGEMLKKENDLTSLRNNVSTEWIGYLREKDKQIAKLIEEKKELEIKYRLIEEKINKMIPDRNKAKSIISEQLEFSDEDL